MLKAKCNDAKGFSLVEVLIVLLILSFLSGMMIITIAGARRVGTATQSKAVAQQKNRYINNIMERDFRLAGVGIYEDAYKYNNRGSLTGEFNFSISEGDLEGVMIPPMEITNGTNTSIVSYFNPFEASIGLTSAFREPDTDLVTLYQKSFTGFNAEISGYTGVGQEHFDVDDQVAGPRLKRMFDKLGGNPILVYVMDPEGKYATLRTVTDVSVASNIYKIKMSPSNSTNQPSNMKAFLQSWNPALPNKEIPGEVTGDTFAQVSCVSYFVYRHPNPAFGAEGWLVRLDLAAIAAAGINVDANDPETIRPYVISENVSDFQVAVGVDSDMNGILDGLEWHNDESMEKFVHANLGVFEGDTVPDEYVDFVNNLRSVRFSIVTYTDETAANDRIGFADPQGSAFSTGYPTADAVADFLGITATLEDHFWDYNALVDRLWYHRAVQITKTAVIRNLDLENTFARQQ